MASCSKSTTSTPAATVVWTNTVSMSSKFEIPSLTSRPETAVAELQILSDNTLKYSIVVSNLTTGDALVAAHIHRANAGNNGSVYIPLDGAFSGSTVTGTVQLTVGQIDTIKTMETYVNVHTTQVGSGLVRGQIDSKVVFSADVVMNAANEVPAGTSLATGLATIRMTENKKLYVKVAVTNLDAGDALTAAHFHGAAAGVNGSVLLGFYSAASDFGTVKTLTADDAFYNSLLTAPIYVNAHSTAKPGGIVRGQIR